MTLSHIGFTAAYTFCSSIADTNDRFKHLTVSVNILRGISALTCVAARLMTSEQWLISTGSGLAIVSDTFITSVLVVTLHGSRTGIRGLVTATSDRTMCAPCLN